MQLADADLSGGLMVGQGEMALNIGALRMVENPMNLDLKGSEITVYVGDGPLLSDMKVEFKGRIVSGTPNADSHIASISMQVDKSLLDVPLLTKQYAGTGGLEGDTEVRGNNKPAGFGSTTNIRPPLINQTLQIYQVDAYGNTTSIPEVFENLASFGPSAGNYANYAALAAANVAEGTWATCIAEGLFRLGADPQGTITCDAVFGSSRPGTLISRWLSQHSAFPANRIAASDLPALTAAVEQVAGAPAEVAFWTTDDSNVLDLIQRMCASCNAVPLLMLDGSFRVSRVFGGAELLTVQRQGGTPQVTGWATNDPPEPWHRLKMPAARSFYVNSQSEIDFEDDINELGLFDIDETYRTGNIVSLPDGSRWLHKGPDPTTGIVPEDGSPVWELLSRVDELGGLPIGEFVDRVLGIEELLRNAALGAEAAVADGELPLGGEQDAVEADLFHNNFTRQYIGDQAGVLGLEDIEVEEAFLAWQSYVYDLPGWGVATVQIDPARYEALQTAFLDALGELRVRITATIANGLDSSSSQFETTGAVRAKGNTFTATGSSGTVRTWTISDGGAHIRADLFPGSDAIYVGLSLPQDTYSLDPVTIRYGFAFIKTALAGGATGYRLFALREGSSVPWNDGEAFDSGARVHVSYLENVDDAQSVLIVFDSTLRLPAIVPADPRQDLIGKAIFVGAGGEIRSLRWEGERRMPYDTGIVGPKPPANATAGSNVVNGVANVGAEQQPGGFLRFDQSDSATLTSNGRETIPYNGAPFLKITVKNKNDTGVGTASVAVLFNLAGGGTKTAAVDARLGGTVRVPAGTISYTIIQSVQFTSGHIDMDRPVVVETQTGDPANGGGATGGATDAGIDITTWFALFPAPALLAGNPTYSMYGGAQGSDSGSLDFATGSKIAYFTGPAENPETDFTPTLFAKWLVVHGGAINLAQSTGAGSVTLTVKVATNAAGANEEILFAQAMPAAGFVDVGIALPAGKPFIRVEFARSATGAGFVRASWPRMLLKQHRSTDNRVIIDSLAPAVYVGEEVTEDRLPNWYFSYPHRADPSLPALEFLERRDAASLGFPDVGSIDVRVIITRHPDTNVAYAITQATKVGGIEYTRYWAAYAGDPAGISWDSRGEFNPLDPNRPFHWKKSFSQEAGAQPVIARSDAPGSPTPDVLMESPTGGPPVAATVASIVEPVSLTLFKLMAPTTVIEGATILDNVAGGYASSVRGLPTDGPAFAEMEIAPAAWTIVALDDDASTYLYADQAAILFHNTVSGKTDLYFSLNLVYTETLAPGLSGMMRLATDGVNVIVEIAGDVRARRAIPEALKARAWPKFYAYTVGKRYRGLNSGPYTDNRFLSIGGPGVPAPYATADTFLSVVRGAGEGVEAVGNVVKRGDAAGPGWTGYVTSTRPITGPQRVTGRLVSGLAIIGLTDDANGADANAAQETAIDFGIYSENHGTYQILENGGQVLPFADGYLGIDFGPETDWGVVYDEFTVKYYADGKLLHTSAVDVERGLTFWAAVSTYFTAAVVDKIAHRPHADVTAANLPMLLPIDTVELPGLLYDQNGALSGTPTEIRASNVSPSAPIRLSPQLIVGGVNVTADAKFNVVFSSGVTGAYLNDQGSATNGTIEITQVASLLAYVSINAEFNGYTSSQVVRLLIRVSPSLGQWDASYSPGASTSLTTVTDVTRVDSNLFNSTRLFVMAAVSAGSPASFDNSVSPVALLQGETSGGVWEDITALTLFAGQARDTIMQGVRVKGVAILRATNVVIQYNGSVSRWLAFRLLMRTPNGLIALDKPAVFLRPYSVGFQYSTQV
jgi:hypothetical protein